MVYFILNKDVNHIKIGYSKNPYQRLKTLQTSCSHKLDLIIQIQGDFSLETYLHKQFNKFHIYNEWFIYNDEIIDFISFINNNVTNYYILRYFDISGYSNEILKEVINIDNYYRSYFIKTNPIELSLFNHKHQLIKKIFDDNIDYIRIINDIHTFTLDDYQIESYLE